MRRTFACSDLHGMMSLYKQIKDFLKPDDIVYFLGDASDRGEENWNTLKKIMMDPQFIYLKGNHEDMLQKTMKDYIVYGEADPYNLTILTQNGGHKTFNGWKKEKNKDKILWYQRLKNLPTWLSYTNKDNKIIFLSHAGFTPEKVDGKWIIPKEEELIWDRSHYFHKTSSYVPDEWISIHGHTPIEFLVEDLALIRKENNICDFEPPMAYWYDNNRKCDIDNGCFYTGTIVLLDLDTFEEHPFYTEI
jgi:calcineurin-like phosphoesterase family protein